mmetsp:Transcript_17936/g.25539  ORF Transcript_17936/g.25539 Transcript_17936/m.25539 type:complete len:205 (-) Transcript_17936:275-889(-)
MELSPKISFITSIKWLSSYDAVVNISMGVLNGLLTNMRFISILYLFLAIPLDSLRNATKNDIIAPVDVPAIMSNASHTSTPPVALTILRKIVTAAIPRVPPPSKQRIRSPFCPLCFGTHMLWPIAANTWLAAIRSVPSNVPGTGLISWDLSIFMVVDLRKNSLERIGALYFAYEEHFTIESTKPGVARIVYTAASDANAIAKTI